MNYFVDLHSHILPDMAGLSGAVLTREEAEQRIAVLRSSNVKLAVAAPVYTPGMGTPEEFLAKQAAALQQLEAAAQPMRLLKGAVLPLTFCIQSPQAVAQFAVGSTGYFLLDLPREPVTERLCEHISRLPISTGLCPVAVDADRFFDVWSLEDWATLHRTGILVQLSVDALLEPVHRKLALYLLANQYAHMIATGGHPVGEPLRFMEAMRMIQRSLPAQMYRRVKNNPAMLLSNAAPAEFM